MQQVKTILHNKAVVLLIIQNEGKEQQIHGHHKKKRASTMGPL